MDQPSVTENIRQIKRRFFAMRNGAIGEQMRRNGMMYRINFGLNLPQIREIAADFPHDFDLADALWHNSTTRESMLIAPMLLPDDVKTPQLAWQWIGETPTIEVADFLCFSLLQRAPWVDDVIEKCLLSNEDREIVRYIGLRLIRGTLNPDRACRWAPTVDAEVHSQRTTARYARLVQVEIEDWME